MDRILIARLRLHSMQRGKNAGKKLWMLHVVLLLCIASTGSLLAYVDASILVNPISDYAHLAGRGLTRHALPAGNEMFTCCIYFLLSGPPDGV